MPHAPGGNGQSASATDTPDRQGGRIKSSPLARKIAAEAGVDLAEVPGSGPAGRIVRADVEAFLSGGGPSLLTAAAEASRACHVRTPAPRQTERIPHTRMRKTIADRMVQAKQTAPEIHVTVDIRMDQVMSVRERLNAQLAPRRSSSPSATS